jgi:hypothetical protein
VLGVLLVSKTRGALRNGLIVTLRPIEGQGDTDILAFRRKGQPGLLSVRTTLNHSRYHLFFNRDRRGGNRKPCHAILRLVGLRWELQEERPACAIT